MADYRKLLRLLQKELSFQEKLLRVLSRERAAIVKLNQEEIERIGQEKQQLLGDAIAIEKQRQEVFDGIRNELSNTPLALKFSDVVAKCSDESVQHQLSSVGRELKEAVETVHKFNQENGGLIKQCLGLIATTVSIMTSQPDTDLPTYGASGKLKADSEDPYGGRPSRGVRRSA